MQYKCDLCLSIHVQHIVYIASSITDWEYKHFNGKNGGENGIATVLEQFKFLDPGETLYCFSSVISTACIWLCRTVPLCIISSKSIIINYYVGTRACVLLMPGTTEATEAAAHHKWLVTHTRD